MILESFPTLHWLVQAIRQTVKIWVSRALALLLIDVVPAVGASTCEPIRILDDSVSSAAEVILTDTFDVMDPGPNQIEMVREAEKRLTPMLCQSVTRLAYLDTDGGGGEMGATNPS